MENKINLEKADAIRLKLYKDGMLDEENEMRNLTAEIANKSFARPKKNNQATEQLYKKKIITERARYENGRFILKTNYVTTERHSCLTKIDRLKRTTLKEMFVNKIHYGYYLECKVIGLAYYSSGLNTLIEDDNGDVEQVVLYNYDTKYYDVDPTTLIPKGTRLLIKEPHLQMFSLKENDFGIRVDSPTNVVVVAYPEIPGSIDEVIEDGNKAFTKGEYHLAVRRYSQAIEMSYEKSVRALLNRSQSYLKIEKYYAAYKDAKRVSELEKSNLKAYFRMGKAAYLMRKFDLAHENFEMCLKLNPKNEEVEVEMKRTNQRLNEAKNGVYDFYALYDQYFKDEDLYMDIADFKSDKIMVTDIINKSKGVVAKENIKKGTLLVVSKAAGATFYKQIDFRNKYYNRVDLIKNTFNSRSECENIANLVYKMKDDPFFAEQVYSLFGGPEYGRESIEHPLIDIKRIEAVHEFNSFQILNSFESLKMMDFNQEIKNTKCYNDTDFKDVDLGAIKFVSETYKRYADLQKRHDNLDKQCGLWVMSAYFNHSCLSNCIMDFIGDAMTIYTIRDVQKDEECTIRYFPPELPFAQRQEHTLNGYKFKCDCKLCTQEENDKLRSKREQILYQMISMNSNASQPELKQLSINEALACIQKIRTLYPDKNQFLVQMITPLDILAKKYRSGSNYKKSAKCFEEIFDIAKNANDLLALGVLKEAYNDYKNCSQNKKCEQLKAIAKDYFSSIYTYSPCFENLWAVVKFNGFNFVF